MDQSEAGRQEPGKESNNKPEKVSQEPTSQKLAEEGSDVPYTQDPNLKDAPSCDKCGQIFPWNQLHRRWKHECPGSAEPHKRVAKSAPLDVKAITLPRPTQSRFTGSPTTRRRAESETEPAATDKDAPRREKCGQTHNPQRWTQCSASNIRRPMSVANVEQLFTASTIEVVNETDGALQVCGCGKTFTGDQGREFVRHKLECPEGTPLRPTGTGKHARGTTLPRK